MWVSPAFAQYPLAELYTGWVYSDPQSNPMYWDKPDLWPKAGEIQFIDRDIRVELDITPGYRGGTEGVAIVTPLSLTGGKNCVVFARTATVNQGSGPPDINQRLPTQMLSCVIFTQREVEGYYDTTETALSNVFGTVAAPHKFPVPVTWNDKIRRNVSMYHTNNFGAQNVAPVVFLTWNLAYLNTGA